MAAPAARTVASIGRSLLAGAVRLTRAQQLRSAGLAVPEAAFMTAPLSSEISQ